MTRHRIVVGTVGAVGLLMSLGAMPVSARDTAIQISPRVGLGRIHIDEDHTLSQADETVDATALGLTVGVVTPIGLMFEVGGFNYSNFSFFGAEDRYELAQETIAVGYQFETKNEFLLVPKVGRMHWRLSDKEGQLGNPGPEAERIEDGYEYFWELTLQKRVAKWVALGVDLKGGSFDFGRSRSITFIATFDL
jgi:hypothetical protein